MGLNGNRWLTSLVANHAGQKSDLSHRSGEPRGLTLKDGSLAFRIRGLVGVHVVHGGDSVEQTMRSLVCQADRCG